MFVNKTKVCECPGIEEIIKKRTHRNPMHNEFIEDQDIMPMMAEIVRMCVQCDRHVWIQDELRCLNNAECVFSLKQNVIF
jgi:hypothetical protein